MSKKDGLLQGYVCKYFVNPDPAPELIPVQGKRKAPAGLPGLFLFNVLSRSLFNTVFVFITLK